ncbi:membrane-anchored junction protein [Paroedura picta]|uniref:membrane-anchored junction protein n=1 Tax=Paroedura picta TaxID=143630 RepID=UPI0040563841
MDPAAAGRNSEYMSLKPFTYPVPETRFIHAGLNVYKFKIRYGNTVSTNIDLHEKLVNKELEEAIRVILGNLHNLHPFTTEHLVLFPYLSKWEKASDLRFKHGHAGLFPYPYVCIVYTELNSRPKQLLLDKLNTGMSVSLNIARDATRFYSTTRPCVGRTRLQNDVIHPTENLPEEMQLQYCGAAIVNHGYGNTVFGEGVEHDMAGNPGRRQQDGQALILPHGPEEHAEWKKTGLLAFLKSTLFPPLLQRILSGIRQSS